jgi:nucleotide-binding universal stress UspA family protein
MLQIENILVPTDRSASADRAFQHASFLADWHEAAVHALTVVQTGPQGGMLDTWDLTEEQVADDLRLLWRGATGDPPVASEHETPSSEASSPAQQQLITAQVTGRSAPDEILRYAEDHDIDLIVMGTHGRSGLQRLVLGSVAASVVREATGPVLTVRVPETDAAADDAAADEWDPSRRARAISEEMPVVRRVLVPVDFSPFTPSAVAHGVELAQTYGARIDLLHVVEDLALPGQPYGIESVGPDIGVLKEQAEDQLADLAREAIGFEDIRVATRTGNPAAGILDYIESEQIDLVVIPTHGRTGLKRFLLGSVAERVVRGASCPVFTLKSFGTSLLPADRARRVEDAASSR